MLGRAGYAVNQLLSRLDILYLVYLVMDDLSLMRPAAWQLFLDLVDEGSLSRLALRLGRAQPQLSRQLAELESFCGTPLFVRHARGLAISEYGQWLLPRVRAWMAHTLALQHELRHGSGVAVGQIRLGVIPSVIRPIVMPALADLRTTHPLVRFVVSEALDSQMEQSLHSARIDLAVRYLHTSQLQAGDQVLQTVGTYLVGPPGDAQTRKRAVAFSALKDLPLVLPCRPSAWRDTLDALARQRGFELRVVMEVDSLAVQKECAMRGLGYTLLGPLALEPERSEGRLQLSLLTEPALPRAMVLTRRAGLVEQLSHRVVAQALMDRARERLMTPMRTR